jgi:hypothetical protein
MDGDLNLGATTHVVAHLLREINGALLDVMRPMVPDGLWPEPNAPESLQRKVDAICDTLRGPLGEEVRQAWHSFSRDLHTLAHRHGLNAPRPVDDAFRRLWDEAQIVFYELAGRIEANFAETLPVVKKVAAGPPDVKALRDQVPHSTVALEHFFEHADLVWLEPLRKAGYFSDPPALEVREDGTTSYARWPQGRFLVRAAAQEAATVMALGRGLETDNPEAQESFVEAACAAPPAQAAGLVPDISRWLATTLQLGLPFKVRDLVVHLIKGGELEQGLTLLRALVTNSHASQDRYLTAELLSQLTPELFPEAGVQGISVLAELLAEQIKAEAQGPHDFSYIWRPSLDSERAQDLRDRLVSAVREAASIVLEADDGKVPDVLAELDKHAWSIFGRLKLDVLARHPDPGLISECLTDRQLFDDIVYDREYTFLAKANFSALGAEAQKTILAWIDAAEGMEDDEDRRRKWQRHRLERLGRPLPGEWEDRYRDLAADGEIETPQLREFGFIGPRSPLGQDELAKKTTEEIVGLLREWEPDGDWTSPSQEGLARVLTQVVTADPERFATAATSFSDVDPTYVRALFGGLHQARKEGRSFSWGPVLELANMVVGEPRELPDRDPRGMELDPGWAWAWQESVRLVSLGLKEGTGGIPKDLRDRAWSLIAHHAEDPNPTMAEEREEDFAPHTNALNSIRGVAMSAAIEYGWWLKEDPPDGNMPPELAELLDRHLDPEVEQTATIRSVYGQYFPALVAMDSDWAAAHVEAIFRAGDDRLRSAAWNAYVLFNQPYESAFRLLEDEYRRAIEELGQDEGESDPLSGNAGESLVTHLMSLYTVGLIDFGEGGLLESFYESASVDRRRQAIDSIGAGLNEGPEWSDSARDRLQELFARRLAAVSEGADPEELRGFAWWFASGVFDDEWSLNQLRAVLNIGLILHPDHVVAGRLAELREQHMLEAVQLLELLIEGGSRQWFVLGARESITAIIQDALAAGGEAESHARDLINRLVSRGHTDFQRLLPD